jgi:hypothetical protein
MPYQINLRTTPCTVCSAAANVLREEFGFGTVVDCTLCGDYQLASHVVARDARLPLTNLKQRALARYVIRRMQEQGRAQLDEEFFNSLRRRSLPAPAELSDNLLLLAARLTDGRAGSSISIDHRDEKYAAMIGAVDDGDVLWATNNLEKQGWLEGGKRTNYYTGGFISAEGWARIDELQRSHIASKYAFFARQFNNPELNDLYKRCLQPAVSQTGYELRTVTQKAGHIDAIIEDEIRRCRFLIADLSDDNAGAYWEAGFAEGLGKDVIYICRAKDKDGKTDKKTHFDTDHRQTVRWDLAQLDETAKLLKAVIRNTLLSDAVQTD